VLLYHNGKKYEVAKNHVSRFRRLMGMRNTTPKRSLTNNQFNHHGYIYED
jgi:hypothetical protein